MDTAWVPKQVVGVDGKVILACAALELPGLTTKEKADTPTAVGNGNGVLQHLSS